MKIVTWNCSGALRKKFAALSEISADVYVIQECENPELSTENYKEWAGHYLWCGESKNKGIGVFAKNGHRLEKQNWERKFILPGARPEDKAASWRTSELKEFLPLKLNGNVDVLAVWTKNTKGDTFGYAGQLWKYLQSNLDDINKEKSLILGDLNSNVRWDRPDRWWNHSDNVRILEGVGIKSLYHESFNVDQGKEEDPTFYLYRKTERPYHIDYIFASAILQQAYRFRIHGEKKWLQYSDHVPLEVELDMGTNVKEPGITKQ